MIGKRKQRLLGKDVTDATEDSGCLVIGLENALKCVPQIRKRYPGYETACRKRKLIKALKLARNIRRRCLNDNASQETLIESCENELLEIEELISKVKKAKKNTPEYYVLMSLAERFIPERRFELIHSKGDRI